MPELPEVEVTRRSVADRIRGARILAARPGLPLRWPLGRAPDQLVGLTVQGVDRRGKYLLLALDDGRLNVELNQAVTIPLGLMAADGADVHPNLSHTVMFSFYDYLPDAAEA